MTISSPAQWAQDFIAALGGTPTPTNVEDVTAWELVEGGNWNNTAKFNPLNTSLQQPGSVNYQTGAPGSGVQAYQDWQQGLTASVDTLMGNEPYYQQITSDLLNSAPPSQFASDLGQSPWDAGHYQESGGAPGSSISSALGIPYTPSSTGAPSVTAASTTAAPTQTLTQLSGISGALQILDGFLNPHNSLLTQIESLGTSDIKDLVLLVVDRVILSLMFLGVIGGGIYLLTKGPASSALRIAQSQQRIGVQKTRAAISDARLGLTQQQIENEGSRISATSAAEARRARENPIRIATEQQRANTTEQAEARRQAQAAAEGLEF